MYYTNIEKETVMVHLVDYSQSAQNLHSNGFFHGNYGYFLSFRVTFMNRSYTLNIGEKMMNKLGLDPSYFELNHNYEVHGAIGTETSNTINYIESIKKLAPDYIPFTDDAVFILAKKIYSKSAGSFIPAFCNEQNILINVMGNLLQNGYEREFGEQENLLLPAGTTFRLKNAICTNRRVQIGTVEILSVPQDIKFDYFPLTFPDLESAFKKDNFYFDTLEDDKYFIDHTYIQHFTGYSIKGIKAINERKAVLDKISGINEEEFKISIRGEIRAKNVGYNISNSQGATYRPPIKFITPMTIDYIELINFEKWASKIQFKFRRGSAAFFRWMIQQKRMLSQGQFNEAIEVFDIAERMRKLMENADHTRNLLSQLMGDNYTFFGETIVHQKTFADGWTLMSFFFYNGASAVYMSLVKNPAVLVEEWDNYERRAWERNKMMYRVVLKKIVHASKDQYTKEIIDTYNAVANNIADIRLLKELFGAIPEGEDLLDLDSQFGLLCDLRQHDNHYFRQYAAVVGRKEKVTMDLLLKDNNKNVRKSAFDNEMAPDGLNRWDTLFKVAKDEQTTMNHTLMVQLCDQIHKMPNQNRAVLLKNLVYGAYALRKAKFHKALNLELILGLKDLWLQDTFKAQSVTNYFLGHPDYFIYKVHNLETIQILYEIVCKAYGHETHFNLHPVIQEFVFYAEMKIRGVEFDNLTLRAKLEYIVETPDGLKQAFLNFIDVNGISDDERQQLFDYINFNLLDSIPDFNLQPLMPLIEKLKQVGSLPQSFLDAINSSKDIAEVIRVDLLAEKFQDRIEDGTTDCIGCGDPIDVYEGYPFACVECAFPYCERDFKEMLKLRHEFHCFGSIIKNIPHKLKTLQDSPDHD